MAQESAKIAKPRLELAGEVWYVENYDNDGEVVTISNAALKHGVIIQRCRNLVVNVESKITSAFIEDCTACCFIFSSLIATVEVVNSKKLKVQILHKAPSILIDKTEGLSLFVTNEGKDVEITSSHSGEVNVNFPKGLDATGDWVEVAIPEQFHHKIVDDRIETRVSDLYSY